MRVFQLCARLQLKDAVSTHIMGIDRALKDWGIDSEIFMFSGDNYAQLVARHFSEYPDYMGSEEDILIFHYSVYNPTYKQYLKSKNKKILVYHNITPPEFFEKYDTAIAEICSQGRELLPKLKKCDLALGDSEYNRLELIDYGFDPEKTGVLPIFVNYENLLSLAQGPGPMSGYEGSFKVLVVGRRVPNKRVDNAIRAFYYYNRCINSASELFVIGSGWLSEYDSQLWWLIDSFGIRDKVHMLGAVSDEDIARCYRDADVMLMMSEHEGFAVPLVECMAFDLPVLAYASTAIPFTMDGSGLMFAACDFAEVGELMEMVRSDETFRQKVIESQRKRFHHFKQDSVRQNLRDSVERVSGTPI